MSILIKNMEMPTSCRACHLKMNCDDCEGWECVCVPLHQQIGHLGDLLADKRREDCPLVPVPAHGDLIDRDALIIDLMDNGIEGLQMDDWHEIQQTVADAPTIIQASEEGKNAD